MAKLIYIANTSLDGFTEDRDGAFDFTSPSAEVFGTITSIIRPVGTYLYGRRMYQTMAAWETAHLDGKGPSFLPGLLELETEFARLWRAAEKVVYSTTLDTASTARTRIESRFDIEQVRQHKANSQRDLTVGGPHLAAALIQAGLVDEFHAFVAPVIVGGRNPWLPPDVRVPLALVGERRFGDVLHLHYSLLS